jgi:GMP synthase-like glutamine amidotransferase
MSTPRKSANTLLVLQHIACEPPAAYEDELRAWGVGLDRVQLDEGDPLPDWRDYSGIVAMGGPMGAMDDHDFPWLGAEKRLIAEAVRGGTPYWGVCLGAQLLAAALGARVHTGPQAEVGVLAVRTTPAAPEDPVFRHVPAAFETLQWHADTFDLPEGATLLASSDAYPHQAFVVQRAYAVQFHLEVTADLAHQWSEVPVYADSLRALRGDGAVEALVAEVGRSEAATYPLARDMFAAWLGDVAGLRRPGPPAAA